MHTRQHKKYFRTLKKHAIAIAIPYASPNRLFGDCIPPIVTKPVKWWEEWTIDHTISRAYDDSQPLDYKPKD